ncbi:restriction endonuclease [Bradyrhizobium aeschynomenes]|uniref:restriction endonuclease n=1 Tax=Bradyrhizobium aeschynomenes TaxID=2734909 RepID=UPI0015545B04|nr:restriction endonuclease [Bradyrhizobium aeschynomenes]NPV24524.1 restriction endonuclease [Bradyrhizobium aeschynomenes]
MAVSTSREAYQAPSRHQVRLPLPRGHYDVDVFAEETIEGITYRILCECKNWRTDVPQEKVHAFRTIMQETGANRGYIISRTGFQAGAIEAAQATNIELVTYAQFQEMYFAKWIARRCRAIEDAIGNFNVYYEPLGLPGYHLLQSDEERAAYDAVWNRYCFAGVMLLPFSPYLRIAGRDVPFPPLPFDVSELDANGFTMPDEVRNARGYRELLALLEHYARIGLAELREVNPLTRGQPADAIVEELDAPMPPAR